MEKIVRRWKAPTPPKFKKLIRLCLIVAAGALALMMAEKITQATFPDYSFVLLPITKLICKNLVAAGVVAAAVAKMTIETKKLDDVKSDVADIKEKTDKLP